MNILLSNDDGVFAEGFCAITLLLVDMTAYKSLVYMQHWSSHFENQQQ